MSNSFKAFFPFVCSGNIDTSAALSNSAINLLYSLSWKSTSAASRRPFVRYYLSPLTLIKSGPPGSETLAQPWRCPPNSTIAAASSSGTLPQRPVVSVTFKDDGGSLILLARRQIREVYKRKEDTGW